MAEMNGPPIAPLQQNICGCALLYFLLALILCWAQGAHACVCGCVCTNTHLMRFLAVTGGWREAEVKVNYQKEELCSGIVSGTTKLTEVLEVGGSTLLHSFKVDQTPGEAGKYSE